jgi:uncharacterized protein YeaO (DUF488 family)
MFGKKLHISLSCQPSIYGAALRDLNTYAQRQPLRWRDDGHHHVGAGMQRSGRGPLGIHEMRDAYYKAMDSIRTKRWNDPVEPDDGQRILVCRYRPRGVRKEDETWQQWLADLGPSKELHAAVYGKNRAAPLAWPAYRNAYLLEMKKQGQAIAELARRVKAGQTITLLCSSACEREDRCHRSLLKQLIEREIKNREGSSPTR